MGNQGERGCQWLLRLSAPTTTTQPHIHLQPLFFTQLQMCLVLYLQASGLGWVPRNSWQPVLSSWNNLRRHHHPTPRWVSDLGWGPNSHGGISALLKQASPFPEQGRTQTGLNPFWSFKKRKDSKKTSVSWGDSHSLQLEVRPMAWGLGLPHTP